MTLLEVSVGEGMEGKSCEVMYLHGALEGSVVLLLGGEAYFSCCF